MWSEWSEFGDCTVTCGGGTQERTRTCTNPEPEFGGDDCVGDSSEIQDCGTDPCPSELNVIPMYYLCNCYCFITLSSCILIVDGMWSEWSEFGDCSVTCGGGTQERTRTCTNPAPEFGGDDCVGDSLETQDCGTNPCPSELHVLLKIF